MSEGDLIKILNPYKSIVERIIPGKVPIECYLEHVARYIFASNFIKNNELVVDIACGIGYGSYVLAKKGVKKIIGIDISNLAIEYGKKRYSGKVNSIIEFIVGDAMKIPIYSDKVDVIVSFETIEHLNDPETFLLECRKILKNEGLFILSTPNKYIKRHEENPYHIRELYIEELLSMLNNSGFDIVDVYGQIPVKYITKDDSKHITYCFPKITKVPSHLIQAYKTAPDNFEEWIIAHGVDQEYLPVKLPEVDHYKNSFSVFVIVAIAKK